MADATRETVIIEPEQVIPAVIEEKIVLSLSEDEALALVAVLGKVGHQADIPGSAYSRRIINGNFKHPDVPGDHVSVDDALRNLLGLASRTHAYDDATGSIQFQNKITKDSFRRSDYAR